MVALLRGVPWVLISASTWREARKIMRTVIIPVMLCDRNLPGLEWPYGFAELRGILRVPTLLLLSDVASSTLSEDILRFGAFDVLSRPFSRESLVSTLEFAWLHWEIRPPSLSAIGTGGT